jgi:hypothetical protein
MPKIVRVTVEGGLVQHVDAPPGVIVIVRDYDTENYEPDLVEQDFDGNEYIESTWEPEE